MRYTIILTCESDEPEEDSQLGPIVPQEIVDLKDTINTIAPYLVDNVSISLVIGE